MDQTTNSSNMMWYIVGAIVIIALAFWYFSVSPASPTTSTQTSGDNTAAAISADFNQISDNTATLDAEAAASAQTVSGF